MWEESQEVAFQTLKQKLMSQPILQYPDFSREFILTTDGSNEGAGAVLSQGQIGKDLLIAYASRKFKKSERITAQLKRNYQRFYGESNTSGRTCMVENIKE